MPSNPTSPWYDCVPLGKEKLQKFVEVMCKEAGINGKKTNHSLRATGATAIFNASVPEKMIRDVTGHRSKALMLYEHPSIERQKAVTSVLMNGQENVGITPAAKPVLRERSVQMQSHVSMQQQQTSTPMLTQSANILAHGMYSHSTMRQYIGTGDLSP